MKAVMDGGEGFGEVSLFGESKGAPRPTENCGAEISVERDQGADHNQSSSCGADCEPRHIGQRTLAERGLGQHSYDYPLDERVDWGADQQGAKERKRSVASRILGL